MRDRSVTHSLALQHLDSAQTLSGNPSSTATPSLLSAEHRRPTLRITRLVATHGAHRSTKRARHVRLLGKALLHQKNHRISLGDRIVGAIAMHRQSGNDDRVLIRFDPASCSRALMTTVFDAAGKGSGKSC
jgi:hypothetical protein